MQHLKQPFIIKTFDVGPMQNLVYVISDTKTNYAAIIDPAWDLKEVYSYISKNNLKLKYGDIVERHLINGDYVLLNISNLI